MRSNKAQREAKHRYSSARKRAEQKEKEASGSSSYLKRPDGVSFFKPKEGVMLIDILPYEVTEKTNPSAEPGVLHYERTYFAHRGIGINSRTYLCSRLTSQGKAKCPICEVRAKMLKEGDDKEDLVKDLAPKERQIFNVIDRKNPDKGIQLFDISYHLFGKVLDATIRNADEEDGWEKFFFLEGGLTLKVAFKEKTFGGHSFMEVERIDFREREKDYPDSILEKTVNLDKVLVTPDYEELKNTFLEVSDDDDDTDKDADTDDSDDAEETPKSKRAAADEDDDTDTEEEDEAPAKKSKSNHVEEDDADDQEDVDDTEDEDEESPRAKKPSKKAKEDEEEGDDDDDFDDFEDKKPSKKKSKAIEEDEEDAEDDDAEEADDSDDEDADDEEETEDEEDEEERPRVKTRDEEVEEDDEEEEPRPRKKKR